MITIILLLNITIISLGAGANNDISESPDPNNNNAGPSSASGPWPLTDDGPLILLQNRVFDPLLQEPLPLFYTNNDLFYTEPNEYRLIQFSGPILPEWKEQMGASGVKLLSYIPDYAFIARVPADPDFDAADLSGVRWVGAYHPYYKLQGRILDAFAGIPKAEIDKIDLRSNYTIAPIENSNGVIKHIKTDLVKLGVNIQTIDFDEALKAGIAEVELSPSQLMKVSRMPEIGWIQPGHEFVPHNFKDSKIVDARQEQDGPFVNDGTALWSYDPATDKFYGYTGSGVSIAVVDTGVDGTHPMFDGRKSTFFAYNWAGQWQDVQYHGTHVAGTALGNGRWRANDPSPGTRGLYAGIAPNASLIGQAYLGSGASVSRVMRDASGAGADISTNSWGFRGSFWYGVYESVGAAYDSLVRDSSGGTSDLPVSILFSAGNSGPGTTTVLPPATAKNIISVGSTDDNTGNSISGFSSRGPMEDGRIKPDILTPGAQVTSSLGNSVYSYAAFSGTSMACPGAAGGAAVIIDYYQQEYEHTPSPALVKAVMLNGATPMPGYVWPDSNQGWGRMNLVNSLLPTEHRKFLFYDQLDLLDTNDEVTYEFNIAEESPLKVHLVWTDVPGNPQAALALVNDLDLIVTSPEGDKYYGNQFYLGQSIPGGSPDSANNVEAVSLSNPTPGKWEMTIKGGNVPSGTQDFAIVISGPVWEDMLDISTFDLFSQKGAEVFSGESVPVNCSLRNTGTLDFGGGQYVLTDYLPDGSTERLVVSKVAETAPEKFFNFTIDWIPEVIGTHRLVLSVDPLDIYDEANESNNLVEIYVNVNEFGVRLENPEPELSVIPGQYSALTIRVHNTGTVQDNYLLALQNVPPGWNAFFNTTNVTVPVDAYRNVTLNLKTPANEPAGFTDGLEISASSSLSSKYSSKRSFSVNIARVYGFVVNEAYLDRDIDPGGTAVYDISVSNQGNSDLILALGLNTVSRSAGGRQTNRLGDGWEFSLSTEKLIVPYNGTARFSAYLTSPAQSLAGHVESVPIRLEVSENNNDDAAPPIFAISTINATVTQFYDFTMELRTTNTEIGAGKTKRLEIRINNNGNGLDNYNFEAFVPVSWSYTFSPESVTVNAFEQADINLNLKVPSGESAGTYDIAVKAASAGKNDSECGIWLQLQLKQDHELNLFIENQVVIVPVGSTLVVPFYVHNRGNGPDTVTLDVHWIEGFIIFTDPEVDVDVQEKKLVNTVIHIPDYFSPGNHTVEITALASDGETLVKQELIIIITPPLKPSDPPDDPGAVNDTDIAGSGTETFGLFAKGYYFDIFIIILILIIVVLILFAGMIAIDNSVNAKAARRLAKARQQAAAIQGAGVMREVTLIRKKREITTVRIKKQKRQQYLAEGGMVEAPAVMDAEVVEETQAPTASDAEVVDAEVVETAPDPVDAEVVDTESGGSGGYNNNSDPPHRPLVTIFMIGLMILTGFAGMAVLDVGVEPVSALSFSGPINTDTIWSENMTLTAHTTVQQGVTLYIMPGVNVWFNNNVRLYVAGTLFANGTENNTIKFTSIRDKPGVSGNPWNGIWNRIQFNGSSKGLMKHCEIERAVYGVIFDGTNADRVKNIRIENCTFTKNRNGIYVYDYADNNQIVNNTIHNNGWGYGIYVRNSQFNYFESNNLTDNTYNFFVTGWSKGMFTQYFENDTNTNQGKPMYYWVDRQDAVFPEDGSFYGAVGCTDITIRNVTVEKGGEGIVLAYTDSSTINNITSKRNNYGIYLYLAGDDNIISNSTVTNNAWGVYLHHSTKSILRNNNLAGNTRNIYILGSTPQRFDHDIDTSNKVQNGKSIYYYVNEVNKTVPSNAGFVGIASCTNITVKDVDSRINGQGIMVVYSGQIFIENVMLYKNYYGTYFYRNTGKVTVSNSTSLQNSRGAYLYESDGDLFRNVDFDRNYDGLEVSRSKNLKLDNCSIISANRWNLNIYGSGTYGSTVTLLNTSFNPNKIRTVTAGTEFTVKWFMNIKALDDLGAPANCRVNVTDGLGNVVADKNIVGALDYVECIGYQQTPGLLKYQFNNYTVMARDATRGIVRDINMTYSRDVKFVFNDKPTGLLPEFLEFNEDEYLELDLSAYFSDLNVITYSTYVFSKLDVDIVNALQTAKISALPDWSGSGLITIRVIDSHDEFIESSSWVTVKPVNDAPVFVKPVPNIHLPEGTNTFKLDLSDYVKDPDFGYSSDPVNWYIQGEDPNAVAVIGENSSSLDLELRVLDPDYYGSNKLILYIADSAGESSSQELWLNVTERNDRPILSDGLVSPVQGSTKTDFMFSVTYWDIEGDLPRTVQLMLDGVSYTMNNYNLSDRNTMDGKLYYYTSKIETAGDHYFSFAAADALDAVGFSTLYSGPFVTVLPPSTGGISGKVVDSDLSLCIEGADITLYHAGNGTPVPGAAVKSNAHGKYAFKDLMPGFYNIKVTRDGFLPVSVDSLLVSPGQDQVTGTTFSMVKITDTPPTPGQDTTITDLDMTITYPDKEAIAGDIITFNGTAVDADGDALLFYWNFEDLGSRPLGSISVYNFSKAGIYNITMTVLDEDGNTASIVRTINVKARAVTDEPDAKTNDEADKFGNEIWLVAVFAIIGLILVLIPWFMFYRKRKKRAATASRKLTQLKTQMELRTQMATDRGLPGTTAQPISITASPAVEHPQMPVATPQTPEPQPQVRAALPPMEADVVEAEVAETNTLENQPIKSNDTAESIPPSESIEEEVSTNSEPLEEIEDKSN